MSEYIKETLKKLSRAVCIGTQKSAFDFAKAELEKYADVKVQGENIIAAIGQGDYSLMLAAHIDEVGFVVTDVDDAGFLTVAANGGIDLRHLPSRRVVVHGKRDIRCAFCSVPPHLKGREELKFENIADFKIDTLLGEKAKEVVTPGDYVSFDEKPCSLLGDKLTGKSLDNRVGVVCLLELARRLSEKRPEIKVVFALTAQEELGCRGAKTAAFSVRPNEAIAIDVTFGNAPDIESVHTCTMGGGAMVGISPVLCRDISDKMIDTAKQNNIKYDTEIMSERTGTDSDVISVAGAGIKTGLLSVPIRNMHTPAEIVNINDIVAACDILEKYILNGGIKNV